MTNPKYADATDQGRYYNHPGGDERRQHLISVTNAISVGINKPALVPWAAKITAEKAVDLLPRYVAAGRVPACSPKRVADECGQCIPCLIKETKREVNVVKEKASDLGTRIHDHADAHVTGRQIEHDEEVEPYLEQYLRFLADFGVDLARDVEAAELTVAHTSLGYAGTLDLLLHLTLGEQRRLCLIDIKTSAKRPAGSVYDEYALQATGLKRATEVWLPNGEIAPMPRAADCFVLNLRTNTYALLPLPSGPREWQAFGSVVKTAKWLHTKPVAQARPIGPDGQPTTPTKTKTPSTTSKAA